MSEVVQLPEICRANLHRLYGVMKAAEREYNLSVIGALTALGLDPAEDHHVDLDAGVITLAQVSSPPDVGGS